MATERVEIVVTATGTQQAASQIESIGKSATSTASTLGFLRAALVAIAAIDIASRFLALSDAITTVQNKLVLVTNNATEANAVFNGLLDVANSTRQPIEATTDVYAKLARATAGQGISAQELLTITKALNEAVLLSGTDASHAANAMKAADNLVHAGGFNLALIMRKLVGVGKPRRLQGASACIFACFDWFLLYAWSALGTDLGFNIARSEGTVTF